MNDQFKDWSEDKLLEYIDSLYRDILIFGKDADEQGNLVLALTEYDSRKGYIHDT